MNPAGSVYSVQCLTKQLHMVERVFYLMSGPCLINFVHDWDNMASYKLDWKESEINKEIRKTSVISFLIKSGNITE